MQSGGILMGTRRIGPTNIPPDSSGDPGSARYSGGARTVGSALQRLGVAAMIGELFLMLLHLPIELVGERIDRGVHVGIDALRVDLLAANMDVRFHDLSYLVHTEHHADIDHMVEMPRHPVELVDDISADRGCDLKVMSGEVQVHQLLLCDRGSGEKE